MHIPDGFLSPPLCILFYILAALFLIWALKGARKTLKKSFVPLVAIMSAVVLIVQMVEFPVAGGGSTWHIMGGTILTMILGPHGTMISMTITLGIQALYGDGGITTLGANIFNMAVIGGLSFYIVKALAGKSFSKKRLAVSLFIGSWVSNVLTALAVGLEIGVYPMVGSVGNLLVTVPTMLFFYVPTGVVEGIVTSSLVLTLSRAKSARLTGLDMLQNGSQNHDDPV